MTTAALMLAIAGVTVVVPRLDREGAGQIDFAGALENVSSVRFRVSSVFHHDGPLGDQPGSGSEGVADLRRQLIHVRNDAPGLASIPFLPPPEVILTPRHSYYLIPVDFHHPEIPANARWLQVEPGRHFFARVATNPFDPTSDPVGFFETVQRSAERSERTGEDVIMGTQVDRYELDLDLERAAEEMPADARAFFDQYRRTVGPTFPMTVWIGRDDGLPYRVSMTMQALPEPGGLGGSVTTVMELFDYGSPVDIRIPTGDEVFVVTDDFNPDASFGP